MTEKEETKTGMEGEGVRSPSQRPGVKKAVSPPRLGTEISSAQRGRKKTLIQESHDISRERSESKESDIIGEYRFGDMMITPKRLTGRVTLSDTAALSSDQAHLVIKAWCDVAGIDYQLEADAVDDLTSGVLLWYAKNTTSQRIDDSQYVEIEIGGYRRRVSIRDCSEAMKAATGVAEDRRIVRVFADLIHRLLVVNTDVRPKLMDNYQLPAWMRTWAFDVAEFCTNPPPSQQARQLLEQMRQQTLARSQINTDTGRNGEKPLPPPELVSMPSSPYRG